MDTATAAVAGSTARTEPIVAPELKDANNAPSSSSTPPPSASAVSPPAPASRLDFTAITGGDHDPLPTSSHEFLSSIARDALVYDPVLSQPQALVSVTFDPSHFAPSSTSSASTSNTPSSSKSLLARQSGLDQAVEHDYEVPILRSLAEDVGASAATSAPSTGEAADKSVESGLKPIAPAPSKEGGNSGKRKSDNEDPDSEEIGEGGKVLKNSKRALQNRAAQRAFRERKEQHVRDLEQKAALLDATLSQNSDLQSRVALLEAVQTDTINFEEEKARWATERDGWRSRETELKRECEGLKGALEESRRQVKELTSARPGVIGAELGGRST